MVETTVETKRCTGPCGLEKSLNEFYEHAKSKGVVESKCKECSRKHSLDRWQRKNPGRPKRPKYAPDSPTKVCRLCGQDKPVDDFHKARHGACGRKSICKQCESERRDPLVSRRSLLKNKYSLTLEDYDDMLADQGGKCCWCGTTDPGKGENYFHVDHEHGSSPIYIYGLACASCNVGRGYFRSPENMAAVAKQWTEHEERRKQGLKQQTGLK